MGDEDVFRAKLRHARQMIYKIVDRQAMKAANLQHSGPMLQYKHAPTKCAPNLAARVVFLTIEGSAWYHVQCPFSLPSPLWAHFITLLCFYCCTSALNRPHGLLISALTHPCFAQHIAGTVGLFFLACSAPIKQYSPSMLN